MDFNASRPYPTYGCVYYIAASTFGIAIRIRIGIIHNRQPVSTQLNHYEE